MEYFGRENGNEAKTMIYDKLMGYEVERTVLVLFDRLFAISSQHELSLKEKFIQADTR
jgi:hypothetical protein